LGSPVLASRIVPRTAPVPMPQELGTSVTGGGRRHRVVAHETPRHKIASHAQRDVRAIVRPHRCIRSSSERFVPATSLAR
jgi:hypothetical protein